MAVYIVVDSQEEYGHGIVTTICCVENHAEAVAEFLKLAAPKDDEPAEEMHAHQINYHTMAYDNLLVIGPLQMPEND